MKEQFIRNLEKTFHQDDERMNRGKKTTFLRDENPAHRCGEVVIPLEQIGTPDKPVKIPGTGVVLGKFYPPHKGHKLLIDTAQANCNALTVIVCDRSDQKISGEVRKGWLQTIHPDVFVRKLNYDGLPDSDSPLWAKLTVNKMHFIPEFAFSSENYGEPWSENMGNTHVLVDKARVQVPISGTKVRENPQEALQYLEPCVAAYFTNNDNSQ